MTEGGYRNTLHLLAASSSVTALDAARNLLENGANVSARSDDGLTPLHVACAYDCLAMAQLLMCHGASIHIEDNNGRTPYSMATGSTQKFLQRMMTKNTKEQRGIIRRLLACHTMVKQHTKEKCFLKNIRKKIQRSLDGIRRRSRPCLDRIEHHFFKDVLPVTEATPTSVAAPTASSPANLLYPLIDGMPQPFSTKDSKSGSDTKTTKVSKAINGTELFITMRQKACPYSEEMRNSHPAPLFPHQASSTTVPEFERNDNNLTTLQRKRSSNFSKNIEHASEVSTWVQERDSSQETEESEVYLTADESFDFGDLRKRLEQVLAELLNNVSCSFNNPSDKTFILSTIFGFLKIEIRNPVSPSYVDDDQLCKIRRLNDTELKAELKKVGVIAGPICSRTRKLYEKKLVNARREVAETRSAQYSRQLELTIRGLTSSGLGKLLDDKASSCDMVREEFQLCGVNAFCYLLLDSRKISEDVESIDLKDFVSSIFYVGKGSKVKCLYKIRPFAHLLEAKKVREVQSPKLVYVANFCYLSEIEKIISEFNFLYSCLFVIIF
ncbi:LEM domain protein [Dictyocaulus viviparus]|uniref:LEM domain protein n=1 Tax=Dictyocaulus viviparus TaxID=29172 RepID=A0A0D8XQL2_DICVI|nr:LEM domain protein [Dictyocaulus viviparus]